MTYVALLRGRGGGGGAEGGRVDRDDLYADATVRNCNTLRKLAALMR